MNKEKFRLACHITATLCFGIVGYGHFCHGKIGFCVMFGLLALSQVLLSIATVKQNKEKWRRR